MKDVNYLQNNTEDKAAFLALINDIHQAGLDVFNPVLIILQYLTHIFLSLAGLWLFINNQNILVQIAGLIISTYGSVGVSTCAHSASHRSITGKASIDDVLVFFGYTLYLGVSKSFWRDKHIIKHHDQPNNVALDTDIMLAPFFAINPETMVQAKGIRRWYYEHQIYFLPFLLGLNAINVQQQGWRFVLRNLNSTIPHKKGLWLDLAGLISHVLIWLILPMLYFDPLSVLGVYAIRIVLIGYLMFAVFAPAHFPEQAICLSEEGKLINRIPRLTLTTINFETGPLGRFLCCGVEYQIEHHIFPKISHLKYSRLKPYVKKYCEDNGYQYYSMGWYEALIKSILAFKYTKPVYNPYDLGLL